VSGVLVAGLFFLPVEASPWKCKKLVADEARERASAFIDEGKYRKAAAEYEAIARHTEVEARQRLAELKRLPTERLGRKRTL